MEANLNGSEDIRINIGEFDLNVDYRQKLREKYKIERQNYEAKILGDISKFKIETENILKEHWDYFFIKPKTIYVRIVIVENKTETSYIILLQHI